MSERKLRFIACAAARSVSPDEHSEILSAAERWADGEPIPAALGKEWRDRSRPVLDRLALDGRSTPPDDEEAKVVLVEWAVGPGMTLGSAVAAVDWAALLSANSRETQAGICNLIREFIGPPSHPLVLMPQDLLLAPGDGPAGRFRRRVTPTARAIAEGVYADAAFDRLPILADALEEAGLDDAAVLAHLRQPGGHARGCWALDLVLGKA